MKRKKKRKPYTKYSARKKESYLLSLAKHIIWSKVLAEATEREPPYIGPGVGTFMKSPKFVFFSMWLYQVAVVIDSLRERGITIKELESFLDRRERRILRRFRNVNSHVASKIADKRFTDIWKKGFDMIPKFKEAISIIENWVSRQPEWPDETMKRA